MQYPDPYTPGAGFMPPYLAGRERLLDNAQKYLSAIEKKYPQQSVIYFGLRGVGKTVLLNAVERMADSRNILYEYIEIKERKSAKSDTGYFEQQIASACKKFLYALNFSHTAKGLISDMTDLFVAVGKAAGEAGMAICFFIDEIQYMKSVEIEALVVAIHRCNQLGLPVMIFGAGLPSIIKTIGDTKSYAERLFKFEEVKALNTNEAKR